MTVLAPLQLLVVCTANQCRSPMGEGLARWHLHERGAAGAVCSAGTHAIEGAPAVPDTVRAAADIGIDLGAHRSRPLTGELTGWSNLTVTMERAHAMEAITTHGASMAATFTLVDLAARAAAAEPRRPDEQIAEWLARIGEGRGPDSLLGVSGATDEVPDPIGRPLRAHRETAALLDRLLGDVFDAIYGPAPTRR